MAPARKNGLVLEASNAADSLFGYAMQTARLGEPSHLHIVLVRQLALGALVAGDLSWEQEG